MSARAATRDVLDTDTDSDTDSTPRSSMFDPQEAANLDLVENMDVKEQAEFKCPRCDGDLIRIRRRLVDRMVSLFTPVRRFRCVSLGCTWEGNLRGSRGGGESGPGYGA